MGLGFPWIWVHIWYNKWVSPLFNNFLLKGISAEPASWLRRTVVGINKDLPKWKLNQNRVNQVHEMQGTSISRPAFLSLLGRIGLNSVTNGQLNESTGSRRCTSMTPPSSSQCSSGTPSQNQEQARWFVFFKIKSKPCDFFYNFWKLYSFFRFTLTCRLGLVELPILDILKHNSGSSVFI